MRRSRKWYQTIQDLFIELGKGPKLEKDLASALNVSRSTVSRILNELYNKGCVTYESKKIKGKRGPASYEWSLVVNWATLREIVRVFDNYPFRYQELMSTEFGAKVVEFLVKEISNKCRGSFEKTFHHLLDKSIRATSYLDNALGELFEDLKKRHKDIQKCLEIIANELTKLDNSVCIRKDDLSSLFKEIRRIALKRFITSYCCAKSRDTNSCSHDYLTYTTIQFLDNIIGSSFYALKFIVLNTQSIGRKNRKNYYAAIEKRREKIWNYAKLALFILSVPPLVYMKYKDNILKFYKYTMDSIGIKKDVIKRKITDDEKFTEESLSLLEGFSFTLATSAVAIYEVPELKLYISQGYVHLT